MISRNAVWALFAAAALYDFVLGFVFLFVPGAIFARYGVTPPNHFGYVQFPGALLVAFALMYAAIARDPQANRNLIPYGALLKVAYCGVVFGYWFTSGIPNMWKPFAIADLLFLALFAWAWVSLPAAKKRPA